jgi:O-antigen ligase
VSLVVGGARVGPPDLAVLLVVAPWVSTMVARGRLAIGRTPGDWGVAILLVAVVASSLASALSDGPAPLGANVRKALQLLSFVALYYFVAAAARARPTLRWALGAFLALSTVEALYAVAFQYVPGQLGLPGLWPPYLADRAGLRAMGTVDASFGHYMAAALILAFVVASSPREPEMRRLGAVAVPILSGGLVSSGTRGSLLAAAAGLVIVLTFTSQRRIVLGLVAAIAALIALAAVVAPDVASPARLKAAFTMHGSSYLAVRLLSWKLGWQLGVAHPWLGLGPGVNAISTVELIGRPSEALCYVEGVMNAYLQAFVEMGICGVLGLLGLVGVVIAAAVARGTRGDGLALGTGAAVLVLAITGLTGPLLIGGIGHLLFVLMGLAAAAARDSAVREVARI